VVQHLLLLLLLWQRLPSWLLRPCCLAWAVLLS
jgi:hypothetical protein